MINKLLLLLLNIILFIFIKKNIKEKYISKQNIVKIVNFENIDYNIFNSYITSNNPVIFKNCFKNKITFKYFCEILKDKKIKVRTGKYGEISGRKNRTFYKQKMNKYCNQKNKDYGGNNIITHNEINKLNLQINNKFITNFNTNGKLWIGRKNSRTPLHKDKPENLALQLYGSKKWVIFDKNDIKHLCYKKSNNILEWSNYDINNPSTCPSAKNTTPIELILNQGDLLYLPKQWSHDVTNLTDSIMINFWYEDSNKIPFNFK